MLRIAFHYLGCRLNEAENEQLARAFVASGHEMCALEDHPDVILLNTCGVTSEAMRKSRNLARRMAALHPRLLILMGCAVDLMETGENPLSDDELQAAADENTADAEPLSVVRILSKDKPNAAQIIRQAIADCQWAQDIAPEPPQPPSYKLRMRSFIKIQDGCNNKCTYCAVRLARGPERSEPAQKIIDEINTCLRLGEREIVLTGVQLGAYRQGAYVLKDPITDILAQTPVARLRLSSIEPWHIRPELWALWKDTRLCPHFHIPVQSGSDDVLTAMKRRTPIDGYLQKLKAIRADIPNVRISTDLIVGFPGETEDMWQKTLTFIRQASFDDVHLFRFSARPNTLAALLPDPVPPDIKRKRWNEAETLIESIKAQRLKQTVGSKLHILWEQMLSTDDKYILWQGYSENYLRITRKFPKEINMRGTISEDIFQSEDINLNISRTQG